MMTDERLTEIREALEAANTNRKWEVIWAGASQGFNIETETTIIAGYLSRPDAEFLCNAPVYVRELLAEIEWLRNYKKNSDEAFMVASLIVAKAAGLDFDKLAREFEDSQRGESRLSASARRRKERKLAQRIRKDQ